MQSGATKTRVSAEINMARPMMVHLTETRPGGGWIFCKKDAGRKQEMIPVNHAREKAFFQAVAQTAMTNRALATCEKRADTAANQVERGFSMVAASGRPEQPYRTKQRRIGGCRTKWSRIGTDRPAFSKNSPCITVIQRLPRRICKRAVASYHMQVWSPFRCKIWDEVKSSE